MSYMQSISTELALRAFNADCEFSSALSELQSQSHGITCVPSLLASANKHGFSWILRPSRPPIEQPWEVVLRHIGGAEEAAYGDNCGDLLNHLLGFPLLAATQPQSAETHRAETHGAENQSAKHFDEGLEPSKQPELKPKEDAAKPAARPDPEKQTTTVNGAAPAGLGTEGLSPDRPTSLLSEQQRLAAIEMVKVLNANARKAFTSHFRSAFKVPGSEKSLIPLITELQHLQFIDRFTVESSGGVAE